MTGSPAERLEILLARSRRYLSEEIDPEDSLELAALIDSAQQGEPGGAQTLAARFEGPLRFGTAGIRGLMGAGESRMNRVLIRRISWALAEHLLSVHPEARQRGIVVARDGRHRSESFQQEAARVFASFGMKIWHLDGAQPTPLAAFAITHLGAAAGVVITASHNPREYNGYKAYWDNGAQIIPPTDSHIAAKFDEAPTAREIQIASPEQLLNLTGEVGGLVDAYLDALPDLVSSPEDRSRLTVAYSALHGVGFEMVNQALTRAGVGLHSVGEQQDPDPDFPTVSFPNPEEPGAMDRLLALASQTGSDAALVNDPDADRLAMAVPSTPDDSTYTALSGNELGILLADFLLTHHPGEPTPLVMTTIVSTRMLCRLAARRGADYAETLTGFKWIANTAMSLERPDERRFVFGFEEAIGYSVGTTVRDKDGVSASYVAADMLATMKAEKTHPLRALDELYRELGHHVASQTSFVLEGAAGQQEMRESMKRLRRRPPIQLAGESVAAVWDVEAGTYTRADGSAATPAGIDEPSAVRANVLVFDMADGGRCAVRPSGTEPKIKFYIEVVEPFEEASERRAHERIETLVGDLVGQAGLS